MVNKASLAWLAAIFCLLAFETYSLFNLTAGDTLSEAVWVVVDDRPLIPFLAGLLCGHFFWQKKGK